MKTNLFLSSLLLIVLLQSSAHAQQENKNVNIVGQMRDVMWKGQLQGNIHLDTLSNIKNLFGLGPVEYLAGEILVIDGKSYKSTVVNSKEMKVEETFDLKAPFFGSANISNWTSLKLPENVLTLKDLETYIDEQTKNNPRPFMFKMEGIAEEAVIHIVNLPKGSKVSNPDEAHQGQINYPLQASEFDIVGFFSTQHKAILTHHDTFLHMHLITKDRKKMGHLDEIKFKPGSVTLYLPVQ